MKIFISWSGKESQQVALALKAFLKKLLQATEPWMSEVDIQPGTRWSERIASELQKSQFGIICVTPENRSSEWVHFEAGALSIALGDLERKVVPLLIGFEERGDLRGPLGLFNAVRFVEDDVWKLVLTLNGELEVGLDGNDLRELFDVFWPRLAAEVERLKKLAGAPKPPKKTPEELTTEILETVLDIQRHQQLEAKAQTHGPLGAYWFSSAIRSARESTQSDFALSPPQVAESEFEQALKKLTAREVEVMTLAQQGLGNREIALHLALSIRTVEGHLYRIFSKLGIASVEELRVAGLKPPKEPESDSNGD
ncbi:LuxR C-terminal-related transcriptional regulator [Arthrobacter sp. MDT3-24]